MALLKQGAGILEIQWGHWPPQSADEKSEAQGEHVISRRAHRMQARRQSIPISLVGLPCVPGLLGMQNRYCPWPRVHQTLQIINHQWDSRNTERTVGRQGTSLVYLPRGQGTKEKEGQKKRKLIKKGGWGLQKKYIWWPPSKVKSPLCKALQQRNVRLL